MRGCGVGMRLAELDLDVMLICGQAAELGCARQDMSEQDRCESELMLVCACDVAVCWLLV
jgi:hypothetical protein